MSRLFCFIILFVLIASSGVEKSYSQNKTIDSLTLALKNAKHDTTKVSATISIGENVFLQDPDSALRCWMKAKLLVEKNLKNLALNEKEKLTFQKYLSETLCNYAQGIMNKGNVELALKYYHQSLSIQEKHGNRAGCANSLSGIGYIYQQQGNYQKAKDCFFKSLNYSKEINDKNGSALALNNLGFVFNAQGDIIKALEYYSLSLKIRDETGDVNGQASTHLNIGNIYKLNQDYSSALESYKKCLELYQKAKNKRGIAIALSAEGVLYQVGGDPEIKEAGSRKNRSGFVKAMRLFKQTLILNEEMGNKKDIGDAFINIGYIQSCIGDSLAPTEALRFSRGDALAIEYYKKALKIHEEIKNKQSVASVLLNLAGIYNWNKKYKEAMAYCEQSLQVAKEMGSPIRIKEAAQQLYFISKSTGNYKGAIENFELFIQMRDSLLNETTRKATIKQQLKYEYEKQAAADSVAHAKESEIKNVQLQKQTAEIKAKKNQQYALFGGLALVIIFAGFMFNRFKVTQKQKTIIEHQKEIVEEQKKLVEEKQKEVLDSIHYARRIQMAQIPSEKQIAIMLEKIKKH